MAAQSVCFSPTAPIFSVRRRIPIQAEHMKEFDQSEKIAPNEDVRDFSSDFS
jgi:hypothetical protein